MYCTTDTLQPPVPQIQPLPSLNLCRIMLPVDHAEHLDPAQLERKLTAGGAAGVLRPGAAAAAALAAGPPAIERFTTNPRIPLSIRQKRLPSASSARRSTDTGKGGGTSAPASITAAPGTARIEGPLALLTSFFKQRVRVRVVIRGAAGVRGYCTGYMLAFDKHFNLVLQDVSEVYSRLEKREPHAQQRDNHIDGRVLRTEPVTDSTRKLMVCCLRVNL